ncbi:hypothetical protein RKD26_005901 [Streptomyces calvus]
MGRRTFVHRAGKSVIRKIAVLSLLIPVAIGCDTATPLSEVKAVAAGAASLAPFFAESSGLGRDADVRSRPVHGGLQQGDTPGLYGGTGEAKACDVERLKRYLTEPRNGRTARAWAAALDLRTDRIPEFLDGLTPVLLRHDTLVRNHDYKKGKAVPFNALLQAGNAILVDEHGLPAVKCSCGNPLRPFEGDERRISVTFDGANEKWKGYDRDEVVVVRPASRELERIALVDVDRPGRGLERPVGTSGERDSAFDTRKRRTVPSLTGATFGEASRLLTGRGLAVAHDGPEPPPAGARVTASDPAAGAALPFGAYVRLSVAEETDAGADTSRPVGTTPPAHPDPPRATRTPRTPSTPSSPDPSSQRPSSPSGPSSPSDRSDPSDPSSCPDSPSTPPRSPSPGSPTSRSPSSPSSPSSHSSPSSTSTASSPASTSASPPSGTQVPPSAPPPAPPSHTGTGTGTGATPPPGGPPAATTASATVPATSAATADGGPAGRAGHRTQE